MPNGRWGCQCSPWSTLRSLWRSCSFPVVVYDMPAATLFMKLRMVFNVILFRLGLTRFLLRSEYSWMDFDGWRALDAVPAETMRAYDQWADELRAGGSPQVLTYYGVPHVFVKGAVPIDDLKVIKVE